MKWPLTIYFISQIVTLYYLYKLEGANCQCVMDWRHNFTKYFIISFIIFVGLDYITPTRYAKEMVTVMYIFALISLYALYTYVSELDKQQCSCAVNNMYWVHTYLYYWRYISIILLIIAGMRIYSNLRARPIDMWLNTYLRH